MSKASEYFKIFLLRTIGNFLLLSAIAGVILTFAPAASAEFSYRFNQILGQKFILAEDPQPSDSPTRQGFGFLLKKPPPLLIDPVDRNFSVVIPKINANARINANVDPGNYDEYIESLKTGVAHAAGTVYPGKNGNTFLFAHSVGNFWEVNRWNAVFYLLRELEPGDQVNIFFQGKRYVYEVYDKKIVGPEDVEYLSPVSDFPKLTLQTCWPPGTTLKRLLVFARLKAV